MNNKKWIAKEEYENIGRRKKKNRVAVATLR
jgi:hypothetical protein